MWFWIGIEYTCVNSWLLIQIDQFRGMHIHIYVFAFKLIFPRSVQQECLEAMIPKEQ